MVLPNYAKCGLWLAGRREHWGYWGQRQRGHDDVREKESEGEGSDRSTLDRTTERWIERQGEKDIGNKREKKETYIFWTCL